MSLRRFMHRRRKDEDLAEEIESHLAHQQDHNVARGLPPQEARRQARVRFGNPRAPRERVWRYAVAPLIDDAWRDLCFAMRSLAQRACFHRHRPSRHRRRHRREYRCILGGGCRPAKTLDLSGSAGSGAAGRNRRPGADVLRQHSSVQHLAAATRHLPADGGLRLERGWNEPDRW